MFVGKHFKSCLNILKLSVTIRIHKLYNDRGLRDSRMSAIFLRNSTCRLQSRSKTRFGLDCLAQCCLWLRPLIVANSDVAKCCFAVDFKNLKGLMFLQVHACSKGFKLFFSLKMITGSDEIFRKQYEVGLIDFLVGVSDFLEYNVSWK